MSNHINETWNMEILYDISKMTSRREKILNTWRNLVKLLSRSVESNPKLVSPGLVSSFSMALDGRSQSNGSFVSLAPMFFRWPSERVRDLNFRLAAGCTLPLLLELELVLLFSVELAFEGVRARRMLFTLLSCTVDKPSRGKQNYLDERESSGKNNRS